jgi:hypothetical protein
MRSNLSRQWLKAEDEAILKYSRQGLSPKMIALKLRRTPRAVQHRIAALRRQSGRAPSGEFVSDGAGPRRPDDKGFGP